MKELTDRSPNLGQKTRPNNNQQKKKKKEKNVFIIMWKEIMELNPTI